MTREMDVLEQSGFGVRSVGRFLHRHVEHEIEMVPTDCDFSVAHADGVGAEEKRGQKEKYCQLPSDSCLLTPVFFLTWLPHG